MAEDLTTSYRFPDFCQRIQNTMVRSSLHFFFPTSNPMSFPLCSLEGAVFVRLPILNHSGDNYREATPVPIPNTVVKLSSVDNTWLVTARKDRSSPDFMKAFSIKLKAFFFLQEPLQIVYKWYNYTNCFVTMLRYSRSWRTDS